MASRKVEEFAYKNGLSNRQAKKRMSQGARSERPLNLPARGAPVAGTGKPKGAAKG